MNVLQVTYEMLPETYIGVGDKGEKNVFNKRKMSPNYCYSLLRYAQAPRIGWAITLAAIVECVRRSIYFA
jgi:hypothetical protein